MKKLITCCAFSLCLILFLLLFSKCKSNDPGGECKPEVMDAKGMVTIEVYNDKSNYRFTTIPFSEFADSVRFIQLETTPECLITEVKNLIFHKDEIIVCDNKNGEIYFFNREGKYLRKITRKGRGPGEYLMMKFCLFDSKQEVFTLFDQMQKKMLKIDLHGNIVKEIAHFSDDAIIYDLVELQNGNYLCYSSEAVSSQYPEYNNYKGLWEVDPDGKFVKVHFNYLFDLPSVINNTVSKFFYLPDSTLCLRDNIHKDIYAYQNGEMKRKIRYVNPETFVSRDLSSEDFDKMDVRFVTYQVKGKYIFSSMIQGNGLPFIAVSEIAKPANVQYAEWYDFDDAQMPAVMNQYMRDNNCADILSLCFPPRLLKEYMENEKLGTPTKQKLSALMHNTSDEPDSPANPIIELIYVKP